MSRAPRLTVYIDPSSEHFLQDRLFDAADPRLNRDGTLLPFVRVREQLAHEGIGVYTADRLRNGEHLGDVNHFWSIGMLDSYRQFVGRSDVSLRGFMLFEPPLVSPSMYAALPALTRDFAEVFVHNTDGDGYSLDGVDRARLRKFHWPQPYADVVEPYWGRRERSNRLVVIAGHHKPRHGLPEFYSRRIEAVAALSKLGCIDLFGRGWERWWGRSSMWLPYWLNRRGLMRAYRGACESKLETLSNYRFSVCLENMPMEGYVTEKIFDCFYAGTVPIYQGGRGIEKYIPRNTFVDASAHSSWRGLWSAIESMPAQEWEAYRENARSFLRQEGKAAYYDSLARIIGDAARQAH